MERSGAKIAGDNSRDHTRRRVAEAVAGASTGGELMERLRATHIDLYIRRNEGGRITGATFIDHSTRTVFNGSRLGKEYSANALQERTGWDWRAVRALRLFRRRFPPHPKCGKPAPSNEERS